MKPSCHSLAFSGPLLFNSFRSFPNVFRPTSNIRCCVTRASQTPLPSPIAVIGASGNMASALIKGLQSDPSSPQIYGTSRTLSNLSHLSLKTTDNNEAVRDAKVILLCVKPDAAPTVLAEIASTLRASSHGPALISIVAGLTIQSIEDLVGKKIAIIRAMPNIAASVGASVSALCPGPYAEKCHIEQASAVMGACGSVVPVTEAQFTAATAVAGCGIGFVFMMAEALADAGVRHGLSRRDAMDFAADTVAGAGLLLREGEHAAILRNRVESAGGMTVMGTAALEQYGLRAAVQKAVLESVIRGEGMTNQRKGTDGDELN